MEPVLFYGVPQGCSFGSIVALEWLGEPYRLCRISMPDDMQGDLYARINSVRETPVLLLEDGRSLSESAAILQNIAARGIGQGLGFVQGTPSFDRLNRMLSFLTTTYFASFSPLWAAYEMAENPPVQSVLREHGRREVAKAHAHLDAMLAGHDWLVDDDRTVADAYLAGIARWADYHRAVEQRDYPNLYRLLERLAGDPAFAFARAIEAGKPAQSSGGFCGHVDLAELEPRLAA
ncbi:MAG: glutathione S-transferase family protein [Dongiaceae bacterium]